jgi:hypothetical protein
MENRDADEFTFYLVLKSIDNTYLCATQISLRPDVGSCFKSKYKLDNSAYGTKILRRSLATGK